MRGLGRVVLLLGLVSGCAPLLRGPVEGVKALGETLLAGMTLPSDTPVNKEIGPYRRFDWLTMELEDFKDVKNQLGGSLNDVVLTRINSTPIQNVGIDSPARASRRAMTSSDVLRLTAERMPSGIATTLDRSVAMTASWIVIGTA